MEMIIPICVLCGIAFGGLYLWARGVRKEAEREAKEAIAREELRRARIEDNARLQEKRKAFDDSIKASANSTLSSTSTTTRREPTRVVDTSTDDLAHAMMINQMLVAQPVYVEAPAMPIYSAPEPVSITSIPSNGYSYSSSDSYSSSSSWSSSSDSSYSSSDSGSSFSSD